MKFATSFAVALLVGGLTAQTTVNPSEFKNAEGPSSNYYPYFYGHSRSIYRQFHYQEIHDLGTAKGAIKGILYRRDGFAYSGSKSPANWVDMEMALSKAKTTSQTASTTFTSNIGTNNVVVLKRKKVNFPSYPWLPTRPQPFFFSIPFDQGKFLAFTGGSVCVDIKVWDNSVYNATTKVYNRIYLDAAYNSTSGTYSRRGRACYSSDQNNFLPFYGYAYSYLYRSGSTYTLRLYGYSYYGLKGGTGIMLIAAKALPTPIPMPGSCYLYVDPTSILMMVPGTGVGYNSQKYTTYYYPPYQGNTRQYLNLPWSNSLRNAKLEVQMVGFDPKANSLGWTFTNLTSMNLPNYNPKGLSVSRIYRNGSTAFTSPTGYYHKSYGLITTFKM